MIGPKPVERCEYGMWIHPDLPEFGEYVSEQELLKLQQDNQFKVVINAMDDEASDSVMYNYYELGSPDISEWEPVKPAENAFLLSIHDTENGPRVWWAVPQ